MLQLHTNDTILFIGDSITDADRQEYFGANLGQGYVNMIASYLYHAYPDHGLTILNRGIGGDKLSNLSRRWDMDCLSLNPDTVSVLIGINDIWHRVAANLPVSQAILEQFKENYRILLTPLADRGCQLVIIEPFVLPYPEDRINWRQYLDPMIAITNELAKEFNAYYVPLDAYLNEAGALYGYDRITGQDGVHPTTQGHTLICHKWLNDVGLTKTIH